MPSGSARPSGTVVTPISCADRIGKEISVLEVGEQAEIRDEAQDSQRFRFSRHRSGVFDLDSAGEVDEAGRGENQQVPRRVRSVENCARDEKQDPAAILVWHDAQASEHETQKDDELPRDEEHSALPVRDLRRTSRHILTDFLPDCASDELVPFRVEVTDAESRGGRILARRDLCAAPRA